MENSFVRHSEPNNSLLFQPTFLSLKILIDGVGGTSHVVTNSKTRSK